MQALIVASMNNVQRPYQESSSTFRTVHHLALNEKPGFFDVFTPIKFLCEAVSIFKSIFEGVIGSRDIQTGIYDVTQPAIKCNGVID